MCKLFPSPYSLAKIFNRKALDILLFFQPFDEMCVFYSNIC